MMPDLEAMRYYGEIYKQDGFAAGEYLLNAANHIELLQWRIETALNAPYDRVEGILRGEYDDNRDEALKEVE